MFENLWAEQSRNKQEINEKKKKILDSALVFEHEQNGFCGILENYTSFCTRERIVIKF